MGDGTEAPQADERAAIDAAVELMKQDRSPESVKRALTEQGLGAERAEALYEELRRLKSDQELAQLDAQLQKEVVPSLGTIERTKERRSGAWMMLVGFLLAAYMLRLIFLYDDWVPRAHPFDNLPRLAMAGAGLLLLVTGFARRRGWV